MLCDVLDLKKINHPSHSIGMNLEVGRMDNWRYIYKLKLAGFSEESNME